MLSYLGAKSRLTAQERKDARAAARAARVAQIARHKAAREALVLQRKEARRLRSDEASAKWHEAQEKKRLARDEARAEKNAANEVEIEKLESVDVPVEKLITPEEFATGGDDLAGLGARRSRCRNPAPFYGTIAKYRRACKKAGNTYDRARCLCVDAYGRVWPYQRQQIIGPNFNPDAYLRQQEYYRQIQAQQLANQQYWLQQAQQQYLIQQPYQQPQYQASFPQGYSANYGAPFPSAFAPGSSGATGPAFTEEAELAASSGGGDDFGLPADTVLFQGKGPGSPAAPTGAVPVESAVMPVADIISGELVVADDMAFDSTPSPVAAPEQLIAPNPITIVPAFSQPASETAYSSNATDEEDGLSGLTDSSSKILGLAAVGAAFWLLMRKK
jgi:hypothetical protein